MKRATATNRLTKPQKTVMKAEKGYCAFFSMHISTICVWSQTVTKDNGDPTYLSKYPSKQTKVKNYSQICSKEYIDTVRTMVILVTWKLVLKSLLQRGIFSFGQGVSITTPWFGWEFGNFSILESHANTGYLMFINFEDLFFTTSRY